MSESASGQQPAALSEFAAAAAAFGVAVVAGEILARHTTFRIGGPADLYAAATTVEQLRRLADLAAEQGLPTTILGGGSNILISDTGVRGLVIANQTRGIEWRINESRIPREGDALSESPSAIGQKPSTAQLIAESGVALAGLARTAIRQGAAGLEWAVSVPGTVGGAVIGNAGAHGGDIADSLAWAQVAEPGAGLRVLTAAEMEFAYRSSVLKRQLAATEAGPVVLAAAFNLTPGNPAELGERADGFLAKRRNSQPTEPSAGSIFRNPTGDYAGRLIEAVGLKGFVIGGAQISPRHANFIVNTGEAMAADVVALMNLARRRVFESTGIPLMPEILFLGDWTGQTGLAPIPGN